MSTHDTSHSPRLRPRLTLFVACLIALIAGQEPHKGLLTGRARRDSAHAVRDAGGGAQEEVPHLNLGHGVLPETNPDMVDYLIKIVKDY